MTCKPWEAIGSKRRTPLPPDFNPAFWIGNTFYKVTPLELLGGVTTQLVKPNPLRIMLGFTTGFIAIVAPAFWPAQGRSAAGWAGSNQGPALWMNLFDFGPVVQDAWFANFSSPASVDVYEVIQLNR